MSLLGSSSLVVTLPVDVNHPESQEVLASNWKPLHRLVGDAVSRTEFAPCLSSLAVAPLPPCLRWGMGLSAAGYFSAGIGSVLCSVSGPGSALR